MTYSHSHEHDFDLSLVGLDGDQSSETTIERGSNTWLLDNVELITVGVDVGSSTSHLVFSKLHLQRLAQSLSSRFVVVERTELFRSPILLTPFKSDGTIDITKLSEFVDSSYEKAGIKPEDVDTGVVILTGVALERKNARAVAELFAADGGKFVCASAGHNLEGILAAHGSGAVELSRRAQKEVLHIDIGGGTSKLALIVNGEIIQTSAISVGARLLAFDQNGIPNRIESAATIFANSLDLDFSTDSPVSEEAKQRFAQKMAEVLVSHAMGRNDDQLIQSLLLTPPLPRAPISNCLITFSGGVSEYIFGREHSVFGDMAVNLADAIKLELSRRGLSTTAIGEGIRATAIGASQFTLQLSGNTIDVSDQIELPLHNLPVVCPKLDGHPNRNSVASSVRSALKRLDLEEIREPICVYLPWKGDAEYSVLRSLADGLKDSLAPLLEIDKIPLILALEVDMGQALGRILREECNLMTPIISLDGVELRELDFVDIGEPLKPSNVLPVMVKSLAFPMV